MQIGDNLLSKATMGWREWVSLPNLHIPAIKAKVDTGARTSALHAFKVERIKQNNKDIVKFLLHPIQHNNDIVIACEAPLLDERDVCNSGGQWEKRYVIRSQLNISNRQIPIDITLTDRDNMKFRMLIGRQALQQFDSLLIDPSRSYLSGNKRVSPKALKKIYASYLHNE